MTNDHMASVQIVDKWYYLFQINIELILLYFIINNEITISYKITPISRLSSLLSTSLYIIIL